MRDLEPDQIRTDTPQVAPVETEAGHESTVAPRLAATGAQRLGAGHVTSLQRMAGNAAVAQLLQHDEGEEHESEEQGASAGDAVHDLLEHDAGQPLDGSTRARMEPAFGQSFESVRVHQGDAAGASAQQLGAQAYTVGNDIVLGSGHTDLGSDAGEHVLAHELTHVVQQAHGPVDGTAASGGIAVSDPGDRFEREAEHTAEAVMAGNPMADAVASGKESNMSQVSVQRMEGGEGEEEEKDGSQ